jgi:hypothetical protein
MVMGVVRVVMVVMVVLLDVRAAQGDIVEKGLAQCVVERGLETTQHVRGNSNRHAETRADRRAKGTGGRGRRADGGARGSRRGDWWWWWCSDDGIEGVSATATTKIPAL